MTRNQIVYSIKELLKDHTDDSLLSNDHIIYLFNTYRAKFLRQLYSDRAKAFDESVMQTVCLDMEPVDRGTCGVTTNCYVLRSTQKLPALITIKGRSAISYVGPAIIGANGFEIVKPSTINTCMDDEYASTSAFIENGYVYVVGTQPAHLLIKCVRLNGLFDSPEDLADYFTCTSCGDASKKPCVTEETPYPVPGHMISDISQEVLKLYMATYKVEEQRDKDNNSVPE